MNRKLFTAAVVALTLYLCSPLLLPVAMGAVFAILFHPWLIKLERRKFSTSGASGLLSLGITLIIVLPTILLIVLVARMGLEQVRRLRDAPAVGTGGSLFEKLVEIPFVHQLVENVNAAFGVETSEVIVALGEGSKNIALALADVLAGFLTQIPSYLMGLVVMLVSTFFFLVDGRKLVAFIRRNSFFDELQTEALISSFAGTSRSVILATVASGFVQSVLFGFGMLVVGRPSVLLFAFLVFISSFLPLIGSAPVTFGVALHALFLGEQTAGIVLLVFAAVAGVIDNFIRPAILKGAGGLHPLLAFVAVFGGLQTIGFAGVFLGPIVAALAVATIRHLSGPVPELVVSTAPQPQPK